MFDRKSTFGKLNSKLTCPLVTMNPCLTIITAASLLHPQKILKDFGVNHRNFPMMKCGLQKSPNALAVVGTIGSKKHYRYILDHAADESSHF